MGPDVDAIAWMWIAAAAVTHAHGQVEALAEAIARRVPSLGLGSVSAFFPSAATCDDKQSPGS